MIEAQSTRPYAGEILKTRHFIFARGSIVRHKTELFQNTLQTGAFRPHLSRSKNGAFLKRSLNRKNFKTPALRFNVKENILKAELLDNNDDLISRDYT